jgi:flagellin
MSADIVLSAGIRQNLLSLQNTAKLQETTQDRLATGKKVNSALDNAVNFFTSSALSQRAHELSNLLDSMTNGVNTLKTASNGLSSMTTTLQSMQATVTQARQDASWQSASYTIDATAIGVGVLKNLSLASGSVTGTVAVNLNGISSRAGAGGLTAATAAITTNGTVTIQAPDINGGTQFTVALSTSDTMATAVAKINAAAGQTIAAAGGAGVTFTDNIGCTMTMTASVAGLGTDLGLGGAAAVTTGAPTFGPAVHTVDQMVTIINNMPSLMGSVRASSNAGQLQITNLSTVALTVTGVSGGAVDGGGLTASIAGNQVRANLVNQFNQLKDQLDKTAADSSFNGINLLVGDVLKLFFNELGTSTLSIQASNPNGINSATLGVVTASNSEFQSNTALDTRLQALQSALAKVSSQASDFGSNLSIVQNRQEFTLNMINTLKQGADGLTLADTNEEGANMLALQTRQQLSVTALSLASQANQSVLKLFG